MRIKSGIFLLRKCSHLFPFPPLAQRLIQIIKKIRSGVTVPVCLPSENRIHLGNPDGFPQFVCLVFGRQSTAFSSSGWAFVFAQSAEDFDRAVLRHHRRQWTNAHLPLISSYCLMFKKIRLGSSLSSFFRRYRENWSILSVNQLMAKCTCILYCFWGLAVDIYLANSLIGFTRGLISI